MEKILSSPFIAVDTETTGLSETDTAFAVIIATEDEEFYFDDRLQDHAGGLTILEARQILSKYQGTCFMQNAKFDMRMLQSRLIETNFKIIDITPLARLVRNDHLTYNLATQAKRFGREKLDDMIKDYIKKHDLYEERTNFFGEIETCPRYDWVPVDIMSAYAKQDARLTYDLGMHYLAQLNSKELELVERDAVLNKTCYQMERIGMKLNVTYVLESMYKEMELVSKAKARFKELTGVDFVNSGKSIQAVLKSSLPTTDKGNPQADADALELLTSHVEDGEIVSCILQIRKYDKRVSTYWRNYLILKDKDNIIHPQMWIGGTRTGRFSYSEPNLQNISKESDSEPNHIREAFVPRDGRVFISLDYSQMEYRLAADYAGEKKVIDAVMNGADFHQATADMVGIERKPAKTLNFAVLYGAGIDKIAGMLKVSTLKAKALKDIYFSKLPKIEALIDGVIRTGRARGYVYNWAGRKLYADREFSYALPNHLIQSSGADVVKDAMVKIHSEFPSLWCVLQVHDQLVFELLPEELIHVPRIKDIMESVYVPKNGIKLTVDITIYRKSLGERHGEKYEC